mmetsp:Transcript_17233/g.31223  ORF Transcript_17233/g.31223 Transcript_17233/m.31223 type:complete len:84 (+) Transcript_17233:117-368(+)
MITPPTSQPLHQPTPAEGESSETGRPELLWYLVVCPNFDMKEIGNRGGKIFCSADELFVQILSLCNLFQSTSYSNIMADVTAN